MTTREVVLDGGSPWGFRLHGGADVNQPLRISRVNPGSKAALRGIREGDFITSINGQSTKDVSNAEAHALLKNSGDSLKLGLNEDNSGSPKRRQYKTIHQETHSETVKKSSVTSYTLTSSKTISQSEINNDTGTTKINGNNAVNGDTKISSKNPVVSQRSTLSSTCSSSSSTPSTYTEGADSVSSRRTDLEHTTTEELQVDEMSDNVSNSRSRRRRSRNNRKKVRNSATIVEAVECYEESASNLMQTKLSDDYRVESPKPIKEKSPGKNNKMAIKSKSLDDDEMVKIQELSEVSENEDKSECKAIVSEAESDVEWEVADEIEDPKTQKGLSSLTLPLAESTVEEVSLISPEEELTLRNFLETLNLVNSPEDAAKQVYEKSTMESIKARKAKKRAALEQYFFPIAQNPRFLDVISEESNDFTDREPPSLTRHLKQGTPELDFISTPSTSHSTSTRSERKRERLQQRMQSHFCAPISNPTILVGTKIIETPGITHEICNSNVQQPSGDAEVVYLEDSSTSSSPDPKSDHEEDDELRRKEGVVSSNDSSAPDLLDTTNLELVEEDEEIEELKVTESNSNAPDLVTNATYEIEEKQDGDKLEKDLVSNINYSAPDLVKTPAQEFEIVEEKHEVHVIVKKNNDVTSKTSSLSCEKTWDNFLKEKTNQKLDEEILTQLTPPPTPDDISAKIEISENLVDNTLLSYITTASKCLSDGNYDSIREIIKDKRYHSLPTDIRNKLSNCLRSLATTKLGKEDKKVDVNKEVEVIAKSPDNIVHSNAISPPAPSPSPSLSSGSSSRATSLCTAKYNPMNSSIADITSITKDEELLKTTKEIRPVGTLRELCLNFLMSQPFGADILQELAEVALTIENLTNNVSDTVLSNPTIPAFMSKDLNKINNGSFDVPVTVSKNSQQMPKPPSRNEKWVGIATEEDPKILLCLSPTQKLELEKNKKVVDEAGKLLDLHEKFIYRTSCYDGSIEKETRSNIEITSIKDDSKISGNNVSNRLLAIIRKDPSTQAPQPPSRDMQGTKHRSLYFVEHDVKLPSNNFSATLPRSKAEENVNITRDSARLKAKDLNEWLQLARNKSTSESDLTAGIEAMRAAPTNNRERPGNDPRTSRRTSLPQDFYAKQMQFLLEKEMEVQRELEHLEEEKRKLTAEMVPLKQFHPDDYHISPKGDYVEAKTKSRPISMPTISSEFFRQQMYEEYMDKIAAREERKQHKVIKVSSTKHNQEETSSSFETTQVSGIEDEFMNRVKQKQKLGKLLPKREDSDVDSTAPIDDESEPVLVMDGVSLKGARKLPKHLQEFVDITKFAAENNLENSTDGVWSPGQKQEFKFQDLSNTQEERQDDPISPVWVPKSATSSPTVERKEFRPVKFESPVLGRKTYSRSDVSDGEGSSREPPWKAPETSSDTGIALSSTLQKRLPTSHSSPASVFNDFSTSRLPKAQNPTITLLQKAREGQLPKGALYIEQDQIYKRPQNERPPLVGPGEILYKVKNEYTSESDSEKPRKMADLGPRKFEGIGPTTREGMPLILRSEVKDANQSRWYKKMYDTIHKQRPHRDEYVTVRYRQRRGQYPYSSGYLSEPEPGAYDSDFATYKYATLDRRRLPAKDKENQYTTSSTMPRTTETKAATDVIKHGHDPYKNQPGRIEHYIPGHSSISEKEAKEWWDEVMDIFDGHLEQQKRVPQTKSFINQALKESGYESDSTLVFRRRDDTAQQLNPHEQKEAYKVIQKGGDVPLHGLRKPAPERPKEPEPPVPPPKGQRGIRNPEPESPRKYVENEVTIHYKTPVRQEIKEYLSEDELAYRQAEAMKKIYQEERRRKYLQVSKSLQELQDMNNRRHTDNFIPSQKSPIPLNRYDDFEDLSPTVKPRPRSPERRLMARALYNFVGQTARELTFRKGDLIYVRRQVDKNWYEGELNAMVGLFPVNYVEIITYDASKTAPRKSHEGQARAKFNFVAQTHLELSLAKGELVVITRKVDDNWYEGKIGGRKGIFPVSYVDVLIDPNDPLPPSTKPVAAPAAHSLLLNGSSGGKESMGSHSYTPNISTNQLTSSYHAKPAQVTSGGNYGSLSRSARNPVGQALHIETQSEPVPYRALYKYLPQNDDELELLEGDTVFVLEKCDDGWYVGSSERTGAFGTFPGNYVEKI